ncbi:hypothetical protein N7490_006040 [Penicillium lividum]|nr:hypothetical protein N7490_006040 [Penicillium lividum]
MDVRVPLARDDYTVGWICALPVEMAAAKLMLNEIHPALPRLQADQNIYILGSIGEHNIVIASLPSGAYGNISAATVGMQLLSSFHAIRIGFMVGIGGGVPSSNSDIRLGDIVETVEWLSLFRISKPKYYLGYAAAVAAAYAKELFLSFIYIVHRFNVLFNLTSILVIEDFLGRSGINSGIRVTYNIREFFPAVDQGSILIISQLQSTLALADRLGGLPLAILIARAFMRETGTNISEYLQYYQESCSDLQLHSNPGCQYQ